MEEPDPAISPAVHRDLQTDLKVAPTSCSSHSLQLSPNTSKICSATSCNTSSCNSSKICSGTSCNTSKICSGTSCNTSSGCNTNKNCSGTSCNTSKICSGTSCNTSSGCNTNKNCSGTSCNTSKICSGTSCNTSKICSGTSCNTSSGCNTSKNCSTTSCNASRCNSSKICSGTTCHTSSSCSNSNSSKICNSSNHGGGGNHNNSCCKASCHSQAGDERKVGRCQPDAASPEKEVPVGAVSRQSNELRLNRRRTKSLPCLHDPSDFFSEFNGGLRKKVKFADSLGLSLASVKHFRASDEPYIPSKVFLRLQSFPAIVDDLNEKFKALGIHCLRPAFSMPCEASDFLQRAERDRVCLEKVTVSHFDVHGMIRVLNISYVKEVTVRYTFNNWLSCMDTPAKYVEGSSHSGTDQFSFDLSIPPFLDQGSFVHFAICYRADNEEYWDNNFDKNYSLQCESTSDEHANT
ncbi:protein phosphatase 1 regulatory subunit 3G [Carcharodon carcharias]|uniref:protein phosphatase 1 regulatory subunit 3G n=1 Tax=Carcharodon carcharias TaxID=13397 RepID=UPI001B7E9DB1|nr:protein phosphatase 1 regulatory subunit 3G [Carcharodon carcharias]